MSKKLIITQQQLNEIENNDMNYFDKIAGDEKPDYSAYNQTEVGYVTGDKIGKQLTPDNPFRRAKSYIKLESYTKKEFEKIRLNELNSQLKNRQFTAVMDDGSKITGSESAIAYRKSKAKQSGNKELEQKLDNALKPARQSIANTKKFNKDVLGLGNQYQKVGGTKNNGGKAHTGKNNDMPIINKPNL